VFAGDLTANDTARVTVTGDGQLAIGNVTASGDTVIVLDLDNDQITGDITGNGNGQIVITASNGSLIIGDLTGNDNAVIDLTVSGSDTWYRGDVTANDDSTVTVTGDGNINIGNVTGGGGSTIDLTIGGSNSGITGGVTGNDDSQITITGSDGVIISGPFNGNNDAVIDITVCGPGSILIGDTTQNDDSSVTITLDDGATGSGGFNGGNLTTGEGSTWTFNKNSHGHRGKNHGTWNVGDYEVIFDDLTNTGTININVNTDTDTGGGGSVVVTGTADGDGKIHIDTTGDGQEDPNKILPGVVTGDGTENWEWDPIDWGIDEIIKDGDHFVKHGTSPAGAVLNSAIAVQQSLWFAQQNSLLKRMGELRYGARTSRPLAGETPAFHNLIENIWLRSYGQQLNVGSKVAGKAYEQLIYGVDLGTDHKFIISADSDLYLGVYAGYGRSDLDYRTPGADGEINSYYGGLYATWLHSSGLYLDATFKAASVDNDLKAPYSNTQLKASYSDVNLGGSLEIGKKFTFSDAWFIEPQFQVNYLHILAEDYTAGPMSLKAQDLDALQLRLGSLFGRTIKLASGGALQPYVKISGVETISSGGAIRNGYQSARANTDGARAEIGGGLIWQLDINNQLHLDYEASFGDKYDKPWGLTAGYRHQFLKNLNHKDTKARRFVKKKQPSCLGVLVVKFSPRLIRYCAVACQPYIVTDYAPYHKSRFPLSPPGPPCRRPADARRAAGGGVRRLGGAESDVHVYLQCRQFHQFRSHLGLRFGSGAEQIFLHQRQLHHPQHRHRPRHWRVQPRRVHLRQPGVQHLPDAQHQQLRSQPDTRHGAGIHADG
ncbi:MAG: autotransporter outer membrane beta-barrel domain-containing protein, partial [Verrucomicrobiales bacterium]|jgi:outer membrane autotransporter protein|nr:autotransporter outer membrane beta-barrel domain-containing protein [Verrucomicrobiales bacterium]